MVYNAMKLFMEINPQLFDDCSHEYTEMQNTSEQRTANRLKKWDQLAEQAKKKQLENGTTRPKMVAPRIDGEDPMTQDSQQRLDALKLQDESGGKSAPVSAATS